MPDARQHLQSLVGRELRTLTGKPNRILRVEQSSVIVATERSPGGEAVPIEWVQAAMDRLFEEGEVRINPESVGFRSAFVGAVLVTLPGAEGLLRPARVRLSR